MRKSLFLFAAGILLAGTASAQGFGVSPRVGTLGPGVELNYTFSRSLSARFGGTYLPYDRTGIVFEDVTEDVDMNLDATFKMTTVQALVDWHPFSNRFRLTGGAVYNGTSATGTLTALDGYTVEGRTFEPEEIGSLTANMSYKSKINPYLGLGLGHAAYSRFGLSLDLGVLYTSSPKVEMEGTGMIAPTASQAPQLEAGFQSFRFYPVVTMGFNFRVN